MLGKIVSVELTNVDGRLGFSFVLEGLGWGIADFHGYNSYWSKYCNWTEEEQETELGMAMLFIRDVMDKAKVTRMSDLKGKPVEVFCNGSLLKEWRILEEVL